MMNMAAAGSGQTSSFASRSGLPTFGNFGNTLLERSNPGLRKSTPDSEALASSDEEVEHSRLRAAHRKALPNRRSSLLADQNAETSRRLSFAGNSYSPAGSQPNTPGVSSDTWSAISPGAGTWNTGSAYPFGTNIWGANSRDPPSRLHEVRQDHSESRHPFQVPSQPNPLVHRSMSFSVGQTENDSSTSMDPAVRPASGLTRRSSRPSNLGHEYGGLSSVYENEDSEATDAMLAGVPQYTQNNRGQTRAMSNTSQTASAAFRTTRHRNSMLEASELAVEDVEEPAQLRYPIRNQPTRRLSEIAPSRQPSGPLYSNSAFANPRNNVPHWSSNLDFGQLDTIPQSRRHSFADVPTRRGSMDSNGMPRMPPSSGPSPTDRSPKLTSIQEDDDHSASYDAGSQGLSQDQDSSYFNRNDVARRVTEQEVQQQLQQAHHQAIFGGASPYGVAPSPSSIGAFHGPNTAPLYVVNFKCCRSDIFYIQEGTGFSVKDGDLVMVEADRGTDLGCVQHSHVSWEAARKYKAKYAEQHFSWLMMFSQQTRSGAPNTNMFNPNAVTPGRGGANPQGTAVRDADLKPKSIKRLAQPHEIQALQEKEGNEAKAKRVCQQRVVDHQLNMEILDAEFQMDGKKLTFYFFSNEYINFNALVTDLFKMYKTRIWMSAINPASFQSPVSSLGLTPLSGSSGLGVTTPQTPQSIPTPYSDDSRDEYRNIYTSQMAPPPQTMPPSLYYGGYGQTPQMGVGYTDYAQQAYRQPPAADPFSNYTSPQHGYGMMPPRSQNMPMGRQNQRQNQNQNQNQNPNARNGQMPPPGSGSDFSSQFGNMSLGR